MSTKFYRVPILSLLALALAVSVVVADAQPAAKKEYLFHGKVEQVDPATKRLTVHSEPIEGWMGAMTMGFAVDNDAVFDRVKAGDQITAKVYEGDLTLHDVQVIPGNSAAAPGAASQSAMRLEEIEQVALANNPTVAQVQANLRVATGLARQAGLYPNPTVGYYGDEIRGGYLGGGKQGGFVSQTIVLGGKLGAARRVADLQASQVETSGQIQRLRILNNVRALFYQVLAAQRLVEVRQNLATLAGDATQTSYQLGNVGQADRPDILQAEVEQQQANVSLRIAQQSLQASWRVLAAVIGKPGLPLARLEGDLEAIPDLNYEESVATTLRESPEVKLAQQGVETAEASLGQAKKAPIPDLQVTGILAQNYEPLETTRRPIGLQGGAQVGVQIPIFNRNQGNVAAAKGEIESAKQELARLKLQLERDLAAMFRDYDSARVIVQQYKTEMLPRAEQAYKLYQTTYQRMAAAYPQVLISQRTLFQLEADYIQALDNAWQSSLVIRGFGLMDGLSQPVTGPGRSGSFGTGVSTSRPAALQ
ncbi:MAG TPA: TolC family protein [Terriglobales bacterium]|nr:TolC family protein [Terriglobales bacterium]HYM74692.1 TolC family protein [Candidatus Dormibacteraeota bacterium]